MRSFDRITLNENVMMGQACIRGTHIPVSSVVRMVADGSAIEDILDIHPELELEDIQESLQYAAWLVGKRTYPFFN
ncbi:MAG: DUF433 domain-containing protein [Chloroflexota bacterium]